MAPLYIQDQKGRSNFLIRIYKHTLTHNTLYFVNFLLNALFILFEEEKSRFFLIIFLLPYSPRGALQNRHLSYFNYFFMTQIQTIGNLHCFDG